MARVKNASIEGVAPRDAVADASIFGRWLRAIVGDTALVADLSTGENGQTPIDHSGAPNGCPIRIPLAAQHIGRSIALTGSATEEDYYILAVPVFVRAGEAGQYRLTVEVTAFGDDDVYAEVRDGSWGLDWGPYPGQRERVADANAGQRSYGDDALVNVGGGDSAGGGVTWSITLGAGLQYVLIKRPCYLDDVDAGGTLVSWALDHDRTYAGEQNGLVTVGGIVTASSSPYKTQSTTFTPSSDHDTYDEEVIDDGPLSAYVLARVNRQINALWERITGALLPGNAAYQTTSTWDNNRASFTAEALLEWPIAIVAIGAGVAAGGKPAATPMTLTPTTGMTDWVRYPTTHDLTMDNFAGLIFVAPDFRTSTSDLRAVILMEAPNGDSLADWRFDGIVDGLAAATEVTPVQIAATDYWLATVTGIPFTAGGTNRINLRIRHTTAGALNHEVQILGAALYFDP